MQLEQYMGRAVESIEARNLPNTLTNEQYVMTHTNNLALMLNELLSNLMQMQNEGKKNGSGQQGMCRKPGKKPGPGSTGQQLSDIITEQKKLGNGMQQMMQPGGKQPGGQGQNGQGQNGQGQGQSGEYGNSEQLARMAQQQAAIRKRLQELTNQLNSKGGFGSGKELREIEQKMDKNETDIVNRRLTSEFMMRQKEITSRLLEVEKSMREQDQDDKRSSKTPQEMSRPIPPALQKYATDQRQLLELYKTVPPQLKPYYKEMVENYFNLIGKSQSAKPVPVPGQ
jgi:hypothetical protein